MVMGWGIGEMCWWGWVGGGCRRRITWLGVCGRLREERG